MWRPAAGLMALALLLAGCGSDEKKPNTPPTTTPTPRGGTLPDVGGNGGKTKDGGKAPPAPAGERIETGTSMFFETPSGKIACGVFRGPPTSLRCDTKYETSFSRSGRTCEQGDYGHSFQLDSSGAGKAICAGDTVASATDSRTIPYGRTWLLGPFSCTARTSGLTCRNGQGHGFSLSVQSQKLF